MMNKLKVRHFTVFIGQFGTPVKVAPERSCLDVIDCTYT